MPHTANPLSQVFKREIERFVEATGASNLKRYRNRRRVPRHLRECALLVASLDDNPSADMAGTLIDVCETGIGFLCDAGFLPGTLIGVKLFWSDVYAPRVPAIVRHTELHPEGFLIGAEFAATDPRACEMLDRGPTCWYG